MLEFLVTNDDGIESPGIRILAEALKAFGKVIICCPASERSGFSHAITVNKPLVMQRRVDLCDDEMEVYTINGSPADTVKLGLQLLFPEDGPDYIFSGINAGLNVGHDAFYSGTIGAAREGVINGIPSVALSMEKQIGQPTAFENLGANLPAVIEKLLAQDFPADMVINVNFPHVEGGAGDASEPGSNQTLGPNPHSAGAETNQSSFHSASPMDAHTGDLLSIKVAPLDYHSRKFTYRENPTAEVEAGHYLFNDFYQIEAAADTDMDVVKQGMIAVSPLLVKPDEQALINELRKWFE